MPTYGRLDLLNLIEDCRQGLVPRIVPLTLLKHHLNRYPVPDWVHQQVYLHPYPRELMLRNHVQGQARGRLAVAMANQSFPRRSMAIQALCGILTRDL